jgi:hypothetical protein
MRRRFWWIFVVAISLGAPVVWYLGSPLFISRSVNEAFPRSAAAIVPEGMTRAQVEAAMVQASKTGTSATDPMPTSPAVLARGAFTGADNFHKGQGTATVYRVAKDIVLRFEPFEVTNGPDLHVILTKHPAPRTRDEVMAGYVEVGKLKGNIGSQNYVLPLSAALEEYRAVVIYCQPFHVVFATASLQPARE